MAVLREVLVAVEPPVGPFPHGLLGSASRSQPLGCHVFGSSLLIPPRTAVIASSAWESPTSSTPTRMSPSRVNAASLISPSSRMLTASPIAEMSTKMRRLHQLPGLRMDERQPEAEHRDVDDLAISPHCGGLTVNVAEPGPGGRLARRSSAVLHVDPSPFLTPSTGDRIACCFRSEQLGL